MTTNVKTPRQPAAAAMPVYGYAMWRWVRSRDAGADDRVERNRQRHPGCPQAEHDAAGLFREPQRDDGGCSNAGQTDAETFDETTDVKCRHVLASKQRNDAADDDAKRCDEHRPLQTDATADERCRKREPDANK